MLTASLSLSALVSLSVCDRPMRRDPYRQDPDLEDQPCHKQKRLNSEMSRTMLDGQWREPGQKRLQHPGGLVITLLACLVVRGLGRKRWEGGGSAVGALALVFLDIRNRHT